MLADRKALEHLGFMIFGSTVFSVVVLAWWLRPGPEVSQPEINAASAVTDDSSVIR
jgi:hypothetical protein